MGMARLTRRCSLPWLLRRRSALVRSEQSQSHDYVRYRGLSQRSRNFWSGGDSGQRRDVFTASST